MPDPILWLKALTAAFGASALIVLAFRLILRGTSLSAAAIVLLLAVAGGLIVGYQALEFSGTWPPANALNRFLMLVLPATVFVELLAASVLVSANTPSTQSGDNRPLPGRIPAHPSERFLGRVARTLRLSVLILAGPVLLHDSVYLRGVDSGHAEAWTPLMMVAMLCLSFVLLKAATNSLHALSQRSAASSIPLCIAMAIMSAGVATMLAGYIKGGVAAIPLAAALTGTTLASRLLRPCTRLPEGKVLQGLVTTGIVGLLSLLCIGRFFGQLTSLSAIVIFLSPLLCWISEVPGLRPKTTWQTALLRLLSVSIPLVIVLSIAKKNFDQKMAPLLSSSMIHCRLTCFRSAICVYSLPSPLCHCHPPMKTKTGGGSLDSSGEPGPSLG